MTITAAADGSALGNPGPMGWAWYIDDAHWAAGGSPHGTNNQGELLAVLELLRATSTTQEPLHIECDSKYVIDSITKWMPGWKRRGWRKADGGAVLNRDLMEALDAALQGRSVSFEWVKGHAGHPRNEAADKRANGAAQAYQQKREPERGPGFSAAELPAAPTTRGTPAPAVPVALWDDDLLTAAPPAELRLVLSPAERERLAARAAASGLSLEETLRRLI